jgi:hypothetical protein
LIELKLGFSQVVRMAYPEAIQTPPNAIECCLTLRQSKLVGRGVLNLGTRSRWNWTSIPDTPNVLEIHPSLWERKVAAKACVIHLPDDLYVLRKVLGVETHVVSLPLLQFNNEKVGCVILSVGYNDDH